MTTRRNFLLSISAAPVADDKRFPSDIELEAARYQGHHVAQTAAKLSVWLERAA